MIIGITGTAATGKSTLASMLRERMGDAAVLELNDLVRRYRLFSGKDRFGTMIVRLPALRARTMAFVSANKGRDVILVGHLLPELGICVDIMIVVRAKLNTLARRMRARGYPTDKIRDNLVDEALDYCGARSEGIARELIEVEGRAGMHAVVSYVSAMAAGRRTAFAGKRIDKMGELLDMMTHNDAYGLTGS